MLKNLFTKNADEKEEVKEKEEPGIRDVSVIANSHYISDFQSVPESDMPDSIITVSKTIPRDGWVVTSPSLQNKPLKENITMETDLNQLEADIDVLRKKVEADRSTLKQLVAERDRQLAMSKWTAKVDDMSDAELDALQEALAAKAQRVGLDGVEAKTIVNSPVN